VLGYVWPKSLKFRESLIASITVIMILALELAEGSAAREVRTIALMVLYVHPLRQDMI